jgi:hypothetical protein
MVPKWSALMIDVPETVEADRNGGMLVASV